MKNLIIKHNFKSCLLLILSCLVMLFCFPINNVFADSDSNDKKAYSYEIYGISEDNNTIFGVKGECTDKTTYKLAQNAIIEDLIGDIDADRLCDGSYKDCTIKFADLIVGNPSFKLNNGHYKLTGKITSNTLITSGLFCLNGGSIEIEDADFQSIAISDLIQNNGNGEIKITSGNLVASNRVIFNKEGGNITINGGTLKSTGAEVIKNINANADTKIIIDGESTELISENCKQTIYSECGTINILGGEIENGLSGYCITSYDSPIYLSNSPRFKSICTNSYIDVKGYVGEVGEGKEVTIYFNDEDNIDGFELIKHTSDINKDCFIVTNESFKLKSGEEEGEVSTSLYIHRTYTITYNANAGNDIVKVPTDPLVYFNSEEITLSFDIGSRKNFTFLGWSESPDSEEAKYIDNNGTPTILVEEENIVLYAVWKAIPRTIEYEWNDEYEYKNKGETITFLAIRPDPDKVPNSYDSSMEPFVLGNPTRPYHTFLGWYEEGKAPSTASTEFTIDTSRSDDITVIASWELTTYNIFYNGLDNDTVGKLGLKTSYTIKDDDLPLARQNFLSNNYTYFNTYLDESKTKEFLGENGFTIHFFPCDETENTTENPAENTTENTTEKEFYKYQKIGQDFNFYIDIKFFHNGQGDGSKNNPFKITKTEQFNYLLTGYKDIDISDPIYIDIEDDLILDTDNSSLIKETLKNCIINGNNHSFIVKKFSTYDNYTSVFPSIDHCTIKDINLNYADNNHHTTDTFEVQFGNKNQISFGALVGKASCSNIINITQNINFNFTNEDANDTIQLHMGGIVAKCGGGSENKNVINGCINNGNINITLENSGDVNATVGGIAGTIYNSMIANSINKSNITIQSTLSDTSEFENRFFVAGISSLENNSIIANSYNVGNITVEETNDYWIITSGLGIGFDDGCSVFNSFNKGDIIVTGSETDDNTKIFEEQLYWTEDTNKQHIYNCFTKQQADSEDITAELGKFIKTIKKDYPDFNKYDIEFCNWYYDKSSAPTFEKIIHVNYHYNGLYSKEDKSIMISAERLPYIIYDLPNVYNYVFGGWYFDENCTQRATTEEISDCNVVNLYSKWIEIEDYVFNNVTIYFIIGAIFLTVGAVVMFFLNRYKEVKFFSNGKLIQVSKFAIGSQIKIPKDHENMLWFKDVQGQEPLVDKKMSCKNISLYTFNISKQKRMENKYYNKLEAQQKIELEQEKLKRELLEKKKQEKQAKKLALKEKIAQKHIERQESIAKRKEQKVKTAEEKARQKEAELVSKQKERERLRKEIEQSQNIVVVKKEVKVIKSKDRNK